MNEIDKLDEVLAALDRIINNLHEIKRQLLDSIEAMETHLSELQATVNTLIEDGQIEEDLDVPF